ncbi:flagellar motor switch protein FliG [Methylobacter psychrophilus]|jgi:flagellar motor switch protein FliG|uniref:flagellar motor switch protein FliG n=1 Tax=Methylobacter psychrophilus TaxID=96941 RepID=UPI0021D4ED38|nr:flagellar motor switch protein FliG [Methylobacter psychrophilus]
MTEVGVKKAAILMLALGQDEAAEVMKFLEPREVHKLGIAMSAMKSVSNESLETVLNDFRLETESSNSLGVDSDDYIRNVLTKALGDVKAGSLLNRILVKKETGGFESLKWMDGKAVAELIQLEHPQIIATILLQLEPYHASDIITELGERIRNEVILRIATMDGVQPAALLELNDVLTVLLNGNENNTNKPLGGIRATAAIMNFMNADIETSIMSKLKDFNAEIAQQVTDEMFVFDNITDIEDRHIQIILRFVQSESLIIALKGAKNEVKEKILKNMSQRAAEMMREDLDVKGPVRLSEVEKQQKEILQIIRRLSDEGQIALSKGNDAYV